MKRTRVAMSAAAGLALALTACGGGNDEETADGLTKITWAQPVPNSLSFYPFFVASELGYFEDEGLSVELAPAKDLNPVTVVSTGRADAGSGTAADLVTAAAKDVDVKVFYEYYQKNVFSIVVPEDSDVQELSDLEGKSIGITAESGGDAAVVRSALGDIDLTPGEDVELIPIGDGGPQVANALEDGKVAAYAGAIQDIVALRVAGLELRDVTPPSVGELPASTFFATDEWLANADPETIEGLTRAWAKATYAGIVNPEQVLLMAEKYSPDETRNPEYAQAMLDVAVELQTPVAGADATFGELRPDQWQVVMEQLQAGGELDGEADLAALLDDEFVDAANDWERTDVEKDIASWTQ